VALGHDCWMPPHWASDPTVFYVTAQLFCVRYFAPQLRFEAKLGRNPLHLCGGRCAKINVCDAAPGWGLENLNPFHSTAGAVLAEAARLT